MAEISKYIFVTGGVLSSLGKGLALAAIGMHLESRGLTVTIYKFDPYIDIDSGTMNPFQHGEVFITDDDAETDLDLGHYERFSNAKLGKNNNFTTGKIYHQVIPYITDEIKRGISLVSHDTDVVIRQFKADAGANDVVYIHLTLVPYIKTACEVKTKPTQHSVKEFRSIGIQPDILLSQDIKTKIALFCNVGLNASIIEFRAFFSEGEEKVN